MHKLQNLILSTLLFFGFLASCINKDPYYPVLLSLEDSVNNDPKQTVDHLKKIDTTLLSYKEKALYYMLLVKGLEQSDSVPETDSLLAYPLAYYTKHKEKEKERLAQLYYLQGEIYRKNNFLMRASESYHQADKYADNNEKMQFRLNMEMCRIYRYKSMEQEEDHCLKKALSLAIALNDSMLLSETFYNLSLSLVAEKDYAKSKLLLRKAISLLPDKECKTTSRYYNEMSNIYTYEQKTDTALYYLDLAIATSQEKDDLPYYNMKKGNLFFTMNKPDSAEHYLMLDIDQLTLVQKVEVLHKMYRLEKDLGLQSQAVRYLEMHVMYRDSADVIRIEDHHERMNNIQSYKRQRKKADQAEMELAHNKVIFYRVVSISLLVIFSLITISFVKERRKRKLEQQLQKEKLYAMEVHNRQQETEMRLLMEQEKLEKIEIKKLNQTIGYYKSLNAITVPAFLKKQKGTMLHLTDEEWGTVVRNTNACFDNFTNRLQNEHPQLTEEDIRFCCLIKMELSISLLSKIYHIANGSISRKKIRLKEKIGIENLSLDEFIHSF